MSLLKSLFRETAHHGVHKKHLKRVSKSCKLLGDVEHKIPVVKYPLHGTKAFKDDIDEVERCYNQKCLSNAFLDLSNDSVEDVFKKFLSEESSKSVNWHYISKLLDEVDSIILRLKYKNKRPRPKVYLIEKSSLYDDIHESKSFSFPSGHTAISYFLSGILSDKIPELRSDFQMLSEMIGHSRVENGVHYPTDVAYGRLIGEMLADHFNNLDDDRLEASEVSTSKNRKISKFFRTKAVNSRPSIEKQKAYNLFIDDLARFIFRVREFDGIALSTSECVEASRNFLQGYPPQYCSKNPDIQSVITCIALSKICKKVDSVQKIVGIHKGISLENFKNSSAGELRNHQTSMNNGIANCKPDKIFQNLRYTLGNIKDPIIKQALLLYIKPFLENTNLVSMVVLANDLDYNFDIVNQILDDNYMPAIERFLQNADIDIYLK